MVAVSKVTVYIEQSEINLASSQQLPRVSYKSVSHRGWPGPALELAMNPAELQALAAASLRWHPNHGHRACR